MEHIGEVGWEKDKNSVNRCSLAAAVAPANMVVAEELECSPHTTVWQKVRDAEAASVVRKPALHPIW